MRESRAANSFLLAMTDRRTLDRELDQLLRESGARVDLVGAREVIRGVLATPSADDENAWLDLIAPDADGKLLESLRALRARIIESAGNDGLATRDPKRLTDLRNELKRRDVDAFLIPKADEHQGEFIARRSERLMWLTGFSGSAGMAVVMRKGKAALFVDGRYTLQAGTEVDGDQFEIHHITETPPHRWLAKNLTAGAKVGFDPWLHTDDQIKRFERAARQAGAITIQLADNPLDAVWVGRPSAPMAPVVAHPAKYCTDTAAQKRRQIGQAIKAQGLDAAVITAPDSIAWLLNIRGGDVGYTPLALGFAILHNNGGVELFMDPRKLAPDVDKHLGESVIVLEPDALMTSLNHLGSRSLKVLVEQSSAPAIIVRTLKAAGAEVVNAPDPCALSKACKGKAERDGMRAAHVRDGAALVRFLAWLDKEAPKGKLTEIQAAEQLAAFRAEVPLYRGPSFATIAGAGAHGAIVHYHADKKSNAKLKKGSLFLLDSGGQYLDGTTDVTRTVAVGQPTADMRDRFTRVLKGHIALARAVFPEGTTGSQLDALARKPLWEAGLDYDHGTGHGVGSYLGVHEGPQRISKHPGTTALQPGMVVSNEPGYYKTGAYGIRIENLVMVQTVKPPKGAERGLLGFDTLTLAPFDRRLIDVKLLSPVEVDWVNAYHATVAKTLAKHLDKATKNWLDKAAKPLPKR